jgi:hypothetical protein
MKDTVKKKGERWWNTLVPEEPHIHTMKPFECSILVDVPNGRYRVAHRKLPGTSKSFSWNQRSPSVAAAQALAQMWAWEGMYSGTLCPLPAGLLEEAS